MGFVDHSLELLLAAERAMDQPVVDRLVTAPPLVGGDGQIRRRYVDLSVARCSEQRIRRLAERFRPREQGLDGARQAGGAGICSGRNYRFA